MVPFSQLVTYYSFSVDPLPYPGPQVHSFESPYVLPPKSDWHRPFSIQFTPSSSECSFNTTLKVSTNATYFSIPLFCFDGRVQVCGKKLL